MDAGNFREQCAGIKPLHGVWAHICGSDLVRDRDGKMYVLEDNLRVPSGVSYMLENRRITKRVFPELFESYNIGPIDEYPAQLFDTLASLSPRGQDDPEIAVLTPGIFNSAYFEHAFLADQMGVELVQGSDLFIENGQLFMRTIEGKERVDVLYRRVDDAFLDPLTFNPTSMLGVPGLFDLYRAGGVTIVNAPGTGIADDKAIYAYVPEIIEFYTGEKPILNNVPTYRCSLADERAYVLDNLAELVVKEVHGSGGYGMLIGPAATKKELADFHKKIEAKPHHYIAQPTLALSTCPAATQAGIAPRHVDLRPFVLLGDRIRLTPGGLTRVALKKGSLVVNSSQGGGTKDTWVLED
jgi:uncharacterized circularly permuted ATP-grasp superfamily protein